MPVSEKYQTATAKVRDRCWFLGSRTGRAASGSVGMRTVSAKDDYDAKVSLISRAFNAISRLVFDCDYTLTPDDWRAIDEARLDDPRLSYAEVRARLVGVYRRVQQACLEKGIIPRKE